MSHSQPVPSAIEIEDAVPAGIVLRGNCWGQGPDLALLLHEPGRVLDAWSSLPERLSGDGLSVVALDLQGHGQSDEPWDPARLGDVIEALLGFLVSDRAGACTVVIAAGLTTSLALQASPPPVIAGVVALSPSASDSDGATSRRWPSRPKLVFVGSGSSEALTAARGMTKQVPGWSLLSSIPTAAQGTDLLATAWARQIEEQMQGFIRTCRYGRPLR